jgi:hypothetical protein
MQDLIGAQPRSGSEWHGLPSFGDSIARGSLRDETESKKTTGAASMTLAGNSQRAAAKLSASDDSKCAVN